jgi:Fe2+ transport system protein B
LPVSFLTALLDWTGWLYRVDFPFESLMNCIGLPGTAAVPLVIAMLTGIYGGIAAMSVLSFTLNQMTLMAVFMMICHSLIQEGMIQGKSGLHPVKAGLLRFAAAIITVWVVSLFLETPSVPTGTAALVPHSSRPLGPFLESWAPFRPSPFP